MSYYKIGNPKNPAEINRKIATPKIGSFFYVVNNTPYYNSPTSSSPAGYVTFSDTYKVFKKKLTGVKIGGQNAFISKVNSKDVYFRPTDLYIKVEDGSNKIFYGDTKTTKTGAKSGASIPIDSSSTPTLNELIKDDKTIESKNINTIILTDPNNNSKTKDPFTINQTAREAFHNDVEIKRVIQNLGIVDREESDGKHPILHTHFDRNGCVDPYNGFVGSKEYVFFTRPDLHLFEDIDEAAGLNPEIAKLPLFADLYDRYPYAFEVLQSSSMKLSSPFITLLTNTIASPIEVPDISARDIETGTNAYGTNIHYRGTSHPSDENCSLSTEFTDNRFLEVFSLFKLYDEYEKQKLLGYITPRTLTYIQNRILSDQIAIFKIIVAEDGESILYMAKYTGCIPNNVPTSVFSDLTSVRGNFNFSINWHAHFFEDFDLDILSDFNTIVRPYIETKGQQYYDHDIPIYDPVTKMINGQWANIPYIYDAGTSKSRHENMRRYKLKWR